MSDEAYKQPYTRHIPHCPDCGNGMAIVTRTSEKPHHSAPIVWSCAPCKKSWSVPAVPLEAVAVEFDNGVR